MVDGFHERLQLPTSIIQRQSNHCDETPNVNPTNVGGESKLLGSIMIRDFNLHIHII